MRIEVKKYLFVGLKEDKERFFSRAQEAGVIDFIDRSPKLAKPASERIEKTLQAIKVVRHQPVVEQEESALYGQGEQRVDRILYLQQTLERLEEEARLLRLEIARVEHYGDFDPREIAFIEREGNRKVQFYTGKSVADERSDLPPELIPISSAYGLDYYMAINREPTQYPGLLELVIERSVGELQAGLAAAGQERELLERELKEQAKYHDFLHHLVKFYLNRYDLKVAQTYASQEMEERLFAIEGWLPVNKQGPLAAILQEVRVEASEVAIEPDDRIPTYLENEGLRKMGEDLIHIYDTPSPTDKDPSLWVLAFFALFFAIIIGDAVYGLVFLTLGIYLTRKFKRASALVKRVCRLLTILGSSCIVWGVLNGAYLGLPLGIDHPLRSASLIDWLIEKKADYHFAQRDATYQQWLEKHPETAEATSGEQWLHLVVEPGPHGGYPILGAEFASNVLLEMTLVIGLLHIALSFMRYLRRNWAGAGWILFAIGAFLHLPKMIGAVTFMQYLLHVPSAAAEAVGLQLMYGGFGLALLLAVVKYRWLGLAEIPNVIQLFSDVLSYLRLYALSFAGAALAGTINSTLGKVPLLLALVILIIGHTVNIVMSAASGVIHGLRLNFLEWYHYSFEGGGRLFKPLKKYPFPGSEDLQEGEEKFSTGRE